MNFSIDLKNRVAVVTGGASGIGRACAVLLAEQGAKVFVADYDPLDANESQFADLSIEHRRCDVRSVDELQQVIDEAAAVGPLKVLVNNAGIGMVKQIDDVSEADWDACLDTNFKAAFFGCKFAIPHMRAAGGGAIVNVSSNAGLLPRAHDPVYSISKGALISLTKSLALCHAADRVRINAVCPGPVGQTRMMEADLQATGDREAMAQKFIDASPLAKAYNRLTDPREIAMSVLYLVSDAATMVTGTAVGIDGGKSLGVPPK
ncbi:4-formylbenzenesulfonate dehydrogenase TsaC1/TsaC2 [Symmachiella macrocystis]|uniref:4-formylbenzenesulfonate dehydrogenase TsaC1/TsaC2 n=1 Tax=Symmachiella macrocystis TaxID=2527985 RepID=A0A5C6BIP9_9PLAN|nr:SDR family NAD(P)-dependent oxidoreductase [Symmachiella macrocystis]TWU11557.1 4-formylbenzenesulfonate dehydrogenase TsaC1/TsaC2 [Symmachiella macrocystis]